MQGLESREAVFNVLCDQEEKGLFLKDLFPLYLHKLSALDQGLAREICFGSLRNKYLLDYNLDLYTPKRVQDLPLRLIFRLAAYQFFFLDTVPVFAVINTAVELVKTRLGQKKTGFTNAVLKKMAAAGLQKMPGNSLKALSTNTSHPLWLLQKWNQSIGAEKTQKAAEINNTEAPAWLRINPFKSSLTEVEIFLKENTIPYSVTDELPSYIQLQSKMDVALRSDLFSQGAFSFQDPAAYLVACLTAWKPSQSILDLCSAPGGKASCILEMAAAAHMDISNAKIYCNDISFNRLRRIKDNRERLGHTALLPLVMNPQQNALRKKFSLVLIDAPCSNLGVLRRRPEARFAQKPEALKILAQKQKAILDQAAQLVEEKGSLIYATCSPEVEETRDVVQAFLKSHAEWILEDAAKYLPAIWVKHKCLHLYPGESHFDGFFAARLTKI